MSSNKALAPDTSDEETPLIPKPKPSSFPWFQFSPILCERIGKYGVLFSFSQLGILDPYKINPAEPLTRRTITPFMPQVRSLKRDEHL